MRVVHSTREKFVRAVYLFSYIYTRTYWGVTMTLSFDFVQSNVLAGTKGFVERTKSSPYTRALTTNTKKSIRKNNKRPQLHSFATEVDKKKPSPVITQHTFSLALWPCVFLPSYQTLPIINVEEWVVLLSLPQKATACRSLNNAPSPTTAMSR